MQVTDPFQMAILTYALQVSHHKERDTAYNRLRPMGIQHQTSMSSFLLTNRRLEMNTLKRLSKLGGS